MIDRYISAKDVREALGCSRDKAYEIMYSFDARKQLYRIGRKLMIKERVFKTWIEEHNTRGYQG